MRRYKHAVAVVALILLATLGMYAFFKFFLFRLPIAASAEAQPIDTMINIHFIMQAFLFSMIMVIMLYSVYAFRRQPGDEEDAPHVHGHQGLEILWTIVPTIVVIVFGIYGAVVLSDLLAPEPNERTVEVVGRRWSWQFIYPDIDNKTSQQLGLLVDEPVVLKMQSEDVIHDFWVPEFRVKQDLLPGRWVNLRITPTEEGTYKVRCAEICGLRHSTMLADVLVMNREDYDIWRAEVEKGLSLDDLAQLDGMSPEERGQIFYTQFGCNGCHSIDGSASAGPTWLGLFGSEAEMIDGSTILVDHAYLYESILEPDAKIVAGFNPGIMSAQNFEDRFNGFGWGDADAIANDLIAYIQTLQDTSGSE